MSRSRAVLSITLTLGLAGCGGAAHIPARPAGTLVGGGGPGAGLGAAAATLAPDPEAAQSFPEPAGAPKHPVALAPSRAALTTAVSPGAPSDAQIKAELRQMHQIQKTQRRAGQPGTLDPVTGTVTPPPGVPAALRAIINGANAITDFPYRFGGGHASFVDNAYDCSASLSYALAAAGLVSAPLTSGELEQWGVPGPGRYLTVFANAGHTFMYVNGLRYDTSGRDGPFGSRWQTRGRSVAGFVVRHWPGL
jgi:hypothetical protein